MAEDQIKQMIERGEMAREHGEHPEALQYLDQALVMAADSERPADVVEVLTHRQIIYKHLYQLTGKELYNELMYGDSVAGLRIAEMYNIAGQLKAALLLRQGDYYLEKKEYAKTNELYGEAVGLLDQTNKGRYAEYLGHYGLAKVLDGDSEGGFKLLDEALQLIELNNDLRPFHKLIVVSGMYGRYAQAYLFIKDKDKATEYLRQAMAVAQELADEHDITIRLQQLKLLADKAGIELK